jgi:hypothetical protein
LKKKVIVRLLGGMGNQLHQYAYGLFLSHKVNGDLYLDCEFLNTHSKKLNITFRHFELNKFEIKYKNFKSVLSSHLILRIIKHFKINSYFRYFKTKIVFHYTPISEVVDIKINFYYLDGLMGFYKDYQEDLSFLFKNLKINQIFLNLLEEVNNLVIGENSVAIHIRRTDYLKVGSIHHVLDLDYYTKSINYIKSKVNNPIFYIFSDDKKFVYENFSFENFKILNYSGDNSSFFDFLAIRQCQHFIIANSTFSWWAAFIGNKKNSIVIAPSVFLANEDLDFKTTYPKEWLIL